ncbi:hypothetical protein JCM6882_003524 [Rhodosporidiobolus microsporus]
MATPATTAPSPSTGTTATTSDPSPPRPFHHHHSHSAQQPTGLSASDNPRLASAAAAKYRASVDTAGRSPLVGGGGGGGGAGAGSASANWRAVSPGRASTGGVGLHGGAGGAGGLRPNSELLGASGGAGQQGFQSAETIDRWFEDLQQYESTLEEMAAASLDVNFKEELGAIEQWFRVLSEAERTAALYSLLQSATQMQLRFFITVLQQMARQDPMQAALLSPAQPGQLSLESQMEAKLASLGFDSSHSPSSPAVRQFARQSLGVGANTSTGGGAEALLSPDPNANAPSPAASTLAQQRAKLKASARTSAPANLLLGARGASNGNSSLSAGGGTGEGLKSPLWSKEETVRERSPSPGRPKSTGSDAHPSGAQSAQPPSSASFLRSPALADSNFENQLSPLVGGSWASMVNTPLVPMFGKNGETMEPGNFGGVTSPNLDAVGQRLGGFTSPNLNGSSNGGPGGIVLDDVRKFRRSARVTGGGLNGGALGGMYESTSSAQNGAGGGNDRANSAATAQKRVQDQLAAVQQQLKAASASLPQQPMSPNTQAGVGGSRMTSSGALSSPGLQQTAMAAQQNWRNANAAHLPPTSPNAGGNNFGLASPNGGFSGLAGGDAFAHPGGLGVTGLTSPSLGSFGGAGGGAQNQQVQAQAQAQLASLLALQQQMLQQQQQLQSLANGVGVGLGGLGMGGLGGMGGMGGNPGLGMAGVAGMGGMGMGMGGALSPRLGGQGGMGGGFGGGYGGGMPSPRRSPRPGHDSRSPNLGSNRGGSSAAAGQNNPQHTPGSGQNPDEPLDMALLGDTPAWLRSLRLHKYTKEFEGVGWREMVAMGDEDLEKKGVGALGARRKLLKVFEVVRLKTGIAAPAGSDSTGASNSPIDDGAAVSPIASGSPVAEKSEEKDGEEEDEEYRR